MIDNGLKMSKGFLKKKTKWIYDGKVLKIFANVSKELHTYSEFIKSPFLGEWEVMGREMAKKIVRTGNFLVILLCFYFNTKI